MGFGRRFTIRARLGTSLAHRAREADLTYVPWTSDLAAMAELVRQLDGFPWRSSWLRAVWIDLNLPVSLRGRADCRSVGASTLRDRRGGHKGNKSDGLEPF